MFLPFRWAMPIYRDPIWIEIMLDDFLTWLTELFNALFRGTVFEWWLLHPQGQVITQLLVTILAIIVWYFTLNGTLRRTLRALRVKLSGVDIVDDDTDIMGSVGDTPIMRRLAPPGHQPTNAQLNLSPSRKRNSLWARNGPTGRSPSPDQMLYTTTLSDDSSSETSDSDSSGGVSFQGGVKVAQFASTQDESPDRGRSTVRRNRLGDRTGRPSNPGYQTPFMSRNTVDSFSESTQLPRLAAGGIFNQEHGRRIGPLQTDSPINSSRSTASQSSPGFKSFMSEINKLKAHVDHTIADLDEATKSPKKTDSGSTITATEDLDSRANITVHRSNAAKKTLREHYYPESVEHPDKFPSSSHLPVPSDEEWGDELVDF